ncbi:acylphosphatase [Pseudaminobacter salicylatoxidans]|uniref:Acylphosphatase n=1 Tax=Pseudaminobacter salicylatoxidans TaxID=93369 RepID=A0A316C8T8_PSESE|nr:acylphosphatase [Pseudaminobacter salicylatoxidans]PWJ86212.1 acylphosphatase [Pseudaminobacter salicylatoxidans]
MEYFSGRLGLGGANERAAEICFEGELGLPFVTFVTARAKRLGLKGWIEEAGSSVLVLVEGPEALVDSFEITCSLGPIDARVDHWLRTDRPLGLNEAGFERR